MNIHVYTNYKSGYTPSEITQILNNTIHFKYNEIQYTHMEDISPYLDEFFVSITENMFAYRDSNRVRKNRRFMKGLWHVLHQKQSPTIDEVMDHIGDIYSDNTKQMVRSNIRRGGWMWLSGVDGGTFGNTFVQEYIKRWKKLVETIPTTQISMDE